MRLFALLALFAAPAVAQTTAEPWMSLDVAAGLGAVVFAPGGGEPERLADAVTPGGVAAVTMTPNRLGGWLRVVAGGSLSVPRTDTVRPVSMAELRVEVVPSGAQDGAYVGAGPAVGYLGGVGDLDDPRCDRCAATRSGLGVSLVIGKRFVLGRQFVATELGVLAIESQRVGRISLGYGVRLW